MQLDVAAVWTIEIIVLSVYFLGFVLVNDLALEWLLKFSLGERLFLYVVQLKSVDAYIGNTLLKLIV